MTVNMGKLDRGLRLIVAAALFYTAFATGIFGSGLLFWGALVVAVIFTLTALIGNCPLYSLIGINTCSAHQ